MTPHFQSRWAGQLTAFVRFKSALGYSYVRSIGVLLSFDRFAASAPWRRSADLMAIMNGWLTRHKATKPVTMANYLAPLRQFCCFRRRYDPQAFVPDRSWAPQSAESSFLAHIFSIEEIRKILAATATIRGSDRMRRCYRLLVLVLYCTGLRVGEALGIRRGDLNLSDACVRVGSKGRIRWVPFHSDLAAEFKWWLRDHCATDTSPDAFVLSDDHGRKRPVKNVSHVLRALFRRCGLKPARGRVGPRCHDLRHTMAVHRLQRWYREGRNLHQMLPWLSAYLGHRDLLGTEHYLQATPELLAVASSRLQRQLHLAPSPL